MRRYERWNSECNGRMRAINVGMERTDIAQANEVLERPNWADGGYGMTIVSWWFGLMYKQVL